MERFIGKAGWMVIVITLSFFTVQAQTYDLIAIGDMESESWVVVPGDTDASGSFVLGEGMNGSTGLKMEAGDMGEDDYYILRGEEYFHLDEGDRITISFWARSSSSGSRLQPWVQEADGAEWMNFGDAYLTTHWKMYRFTVSLSSQTSGNYKVKFRGYDVGNIYLDDVRIGPVDYEDVQQSGIYEVSLSQNGMTWPVNVFRNTCPDFQLGYQNMEAKDQHPLDLFSGRTISWAKFSFEDPITVRVKVINTQKVPVSGQSIDILPSRHGITATANGNVVSFTITHPGQYSVEIGSEGYKNGLMIFADPPETDIPSKSDPDYRVLYEADGSDLSSIPTHYTGVYFERGVHDIGIFDIPSHIKNIYFEEGSWVYGALKMDGNPGVRIFGRGVLSSYKFNYRQTHCIEAVNGSNDIEIEGLVVADPKYFAVRLIGTHNTVNFTKVIGGWVYNCDGIAAFKGSTVANSFIWANDDAIKVYRDSITWSDIVVWQLNNGGIIQISWGGAIGGSTSRGVSISGVDVLRAEWDKPRFNTALLGCVGNRYHIDGKYALLEDWLIEDVVTERSVPVIFNITPDEYTHNHIDGLTLKNWDVKMTMGTSFKNRIMGEDPDHFLSGFVFDSVVFNGRLLTNINYITTGDMESGGWVGVPKTTDQNMILGAGLGTGGSVGLRSVVTNMGGGNYYVMKCDEKFHLDHNDEITVSFWAKATASGKKLVPWVQETENFEWMNIGEAYLTTNWKWYSFTAVMDKSTSDHYQVKFRGYETAWMFIDKVQIGPVDWRTVIKPEIRYLNTPTFLPAPPPGMLTPVTQLRELKSRDRVKMSPNPAFDILFIEDNDRETPFIIYSVAGYPVMAGLGKRVDVSALKTGMYILRVMDRPGAKFFKK